MGLGLRGNSCSAEIRGGRMTDHAICQCHLDAKLVPKAGSQSQAEKASLVLVSMSHLNTMNINHKNCVSPMSLSQKKLNVGKAWK